MLGLRWMTKITREYKNSHSLIVLTRAGTRTCVTVSGRASFKGPEDSNACASWVVSESFICLSRVAGKEAWPFMMGRPEALSTTLADLGKLPHREPWFCHL